MTSSDVFGEIGEVDVGASSILFGDEGAAQGAVEQLAAKFAGRGDVARAAAEVADECRRDLGEYGPARRLYEKLLAGYPESTQAMRAQRGIVNIDIKTGNYEAAEAGVETLLGKYPNHDGLPQAFCWLGNDYLDARQDDKAARCYQYVIDNSPDSNAAMSSWSGIARVHIRRGDDQAAQGVIDKIIADFNDYPGVVHQISYIGDEYYYTHQYQKAIDVWELVYTSYPEGRRPNLLPYLLATCYAHLKEYDKAIEFYTEVVEKNPNCKYGYRAAYRLGLTYRRAGKFDKAIEWFERQRTLHPENEMYVERSLTGQAATYYYELRDYEKAAETYEQYIGEFPDAKPISTMYLFLARCNAKLGRKDRAEAVLEAALIKLGDSERAEILRTELEELRKGGK